MATSWEQVGGEGHLPGATCHAPVPPSQPLSLALSLLPPKANEHSWPRGEKSMWANTPFLLPVSSSATAQHKTFPS